MIARRDPINAVVRTAVAYGTSRLATAEVSAADGREQGFFARLLKALDETRHLQARRVVERHAHLLPPGHDWHL